MNVYHSIEEIEDPKKLPNYILHALDKGNPVGEEDGDWFLLVLDDRDLDTPIYGYSEEDDNPQD